MIYDDAVTAEVLMMEKKGKETGNEKVHKGVILPFFFREKMNLNELVFDCAIILFPFFIGNFYDPIMNLRPFDIPFVMILLLLSIYFIPILVGKMYNGDFAASSVSVRKIVLATLFVTTIFAFGNLLYYSVSTFKDPTASQMMIFISGVVLLIMGPIAGLIFTAKENETEEISAQTIMFLFTAGILPLFFILVAGGTYFKDVNGFVAFLIILGSFIGDVIFIMLLMFGAIMMKRLLVRSGLYPKTAFAMRMLTPFFLSMVLVFFNIHAEQLFVRGVGIAGLGSVILITVLLIVSGVLPLRVLLMLSPPIRLINIMIGVASIAIMFFSLLRR